jgi:hypothetical protein
MSRRQSFLLDLDRSPREIDGSKTEKGSKQKKRTTDKNEELHHQNE